MTYFTQEQEITSLIFCIIGLAMIFGSLLFIGGLAAVGFALIGLAFMMPTLRIFLEQDKR